MVNRALLTDYGPPKNRRVNFEPKSVTHRTAAPLSLHLSVSQSFPSLCPLILSPSQPLTFFSSALRSPRCPISDVRPQSLPSLRPSVSQSLPSLSPSLSSDIRPRTSDICLYPPSSHPLTFLSSFFHTPSYPLPLPTSDLRHRTSDSPLRAPRSALCAMRFAPCSLR